MFLHNSFSHNPLEQNEAFLPRDNFGIWVKYPSDLQSSKLTSKLLTRSEGTIGELKMLLGAAAAAAMGNGTERTTEETIDGCNYMSPSIRKQRSVSG
jgi:hypothetical protein